MRATPSFSVLLALLVGTAGGCDSPELLGPDAPQGIDGIALLGPQCPVQSAENPCPDQPHQASIEVWKVGGGSVTHVQSGADGRFRVGLRAGQYVLVPEEGDPFPTAGQREVTVAEGVYTSVTLNFDTGIR